MAIEIVPFAKEHVNAAVDIHTRAFPEFFLTFLGRGFLREFYRAFADNPEAIAFSAVDAESGAVLGTVIGAVRPAGFYQRLLKRRWWAFCLHSALAVVRKPTIIPRLFRALFYRGDTPTQGPERSLMASMAVEPNLQGGGVGKRLCQAYLDRARALGLPGVYLTTDKENNEGVNRFHQRAGLRLESSFVTPEGRAMNRYVIDFEPAETAQQRPPSQTVN